MNNGQAAAATNVYAERNPYKVDNPYDKKDPHKRDKDQKELKEKKGHWALDFEILRLFRESFNSMIDLEESPRAFFDEEHLLDLRLRLLSRNFGTAILKLIFMSLFSILSLFLTIKGVLVIGFIYIVAWIYYVVVPLSFVGYSRQYIIDDTETGKLKKLHTTYAKWTKPLENLTMNTLTVAFIILEILIAFNTLFVLNIIDSIAKYVKVDSFVSYLSSISASDILNSASLTIVIYISSFVFYRLFLYSFWGPKWEAKRLENVKLFNRANQRTARNLKDELTKGDM